MKQLAAPLLMPGVRLDRDAGGETKRALERARLPWVMGFCLFGGELEQVASLVRNLEDAAGRELRFASDMERGGGQQVRGLATHPPLGVFGAVADAAEVEAIARAAASQARRAGVDVLFAPVLDVRSEPRNPIVGARSFGSDAQRVAELGAAYCRGALAGGAFPVGKHWPGHGPTVDDSHDACPLVEVPGDVLRARDLLPFEAAARAGCRAFMTAHVRYPTLDPSGVVATFSRVLCDEARALGDAERPMVLVSDALLMAGALGEGVDETEAARRALEAGVDVLLYPEQPEDVAAHLFDVDAARAARLAEQAEAARERLARTWGVRPPAAAPDAAAALVASVAARAVQPLAEHLAPARAVLVVDDDGTPESPVHGAVLMECLTDAGIPVRRVFSRGDYLPPPASVAPATVVVAAEVRAWKGAAGVSEPLQEWLGRLPPHTPRVGLAPAHLDGIPGVIGHGPELEAALADLLRSRP